MGNLESTKYIERELTNCNGVKDIEEIMNFALLWNMFECNIFGKSINNTKINEEYPKIARSIREKLIEDVFSYFRNRYVVEANGEHRFKNLYIERTDKAIKKDMYNDLKSNDCSNEIKVKDIIYIIYRLRNNLFHGEKKIKKLSKQNEMFEKCNGFIIECLKNENKIKNNN